MKKIMLEGNEVKELVLESLPMLIHGEHGVGSSLYTVCLAAKWYRQGYQVLFLCGYVAAEEAFTQEVGEDHSHAKFYPQEKVDEFIADLKQNRTQNTVVVVKNIELFDNKVFNAVKALPNLIISGDVSKSTVKNVLLHKKFTTEVYFSPLNGKALPHLEKFHAVVLSGDYKGITSVSE